MNDDILYGGQRMMIVTKGDKLKRDKKHYVVIVADEDIFVLAEYNNTTKITNFENLEAYSNDSTINTLYDLRFSKYTDFMK